MRARWLRLSGSVLIAAATLGPLLVGSAIYSQREVASAGEAVLQAEGAGWTRGVGSRLRELRELESPAAAEVLKSFLEESRAEGLRYVSHVSRDGRIEAGTPSSAPIEEASLKGNVATWVGDRVRFVMPAFPLGRRPPPPRPEAPPPEGPRPWRPRAWLLVEFEPRAYPELMSASRRTFALGTITAATVVLLAGWLWQSMRRRHAVEREAERARHLAAVGEMSAVLAHEIRNPLASLKGNAQLLAEGLTAPALDKPRAKAERIVEEAVRIERITTDLLDFVREAKLDRVPTELGGLARVSLEGVVPPERLQLDVAGGNIELPVDANRLRQVIENVARNAVQAGDGPVEVALKQEPQTVVLTVRDHGPGIPAGQEQRIFEPFVTTRTRGTGLGLAIARRIVDRHGGTLTGSNHPGGGAIFTLTLPRAS